MASHLVLIRGGVGQLTWLGCCKGSLQALQEGQAEVVRDAQHFGIFVVRLPWRLLNSSFWTNEESLERCGSGLTRAAWVMLVGAYKRQPL